MPPKFNTPGKRPRVTNRGVKRLRGSYPQLTIEEQPSDRRRRQNLYEEAVDDADVPEETLGILQQAVDAVYGSNEWIGGQRSDGRNQGNAAGMATARSANDQVAKEHDHCLVAAGSAVEGRYCDEDAADKFYEEGGYSASLAMEAVALSERLGMDYHNLESKTAMPESSTRPNGKSKFNDDSNLIGAEGTRVGAFNGKRLRIAVGPRVYNNNVSAFAELLNRTQRVHNEFALSYKAHENMRCWNMLHFRHMRHDSAHDDGTYRALPAGINILKPTSEFNNIAGIKTPFIELKTTPDAATTANPYPSGFKGDFYAPTSLVDLENLSYNLQTITRVFNQQIAQRPSVSGGTAAQYVPAEPEQSFKDCELFAARSQIYINNTDVGGYDSGTAKTVYSRRVENRAHLVGGSVNLVFSNVSGQPALISIVLYKGKKTAASMQDFGEAAAGTSGGAVAASGDFTTSAVCTTCVENPPTWDGGAPDATVIGNPEFTANHSLSPAVATNGIGERVYRASSAGVKDRVHRAIALKDFKGDEFVPNDVSINPRKKFLPKSTVAGDTNKSNPVSEHYRVSYVLAGGATRAVKIDLPGQLYDPASAMFGQDLTLNAAGTGFKNETSQINSQLYSLAIGVSGVRGLQQWQNAADPVQTAIYGQGYGPANVQVKARYTETVGAMRPVVPKAPLGFGFNELQDTVKTETNPADMHIVTVLPQSMIVRTDDKPIAGKMDVDPATAHN